MLNSMEITFAIFIAATIAVFFSGYHSGRQQNVNKLCNKSKYNFCQQVSYEIIKKKKKDFLD